MRYLLQMLVQLRLAYQGVPFDVSARLFENDVISVSVMNWLYRMKDRYA